MKLLVWRAVRFRWSVSLVGAHPEPVPNPPRELAESASSANLKIPVQSRTLPKPESEGKRDEAFSFFIELERYCQ